MCRPERKIATTNLICDHILISCFFCFVELQKIIMLKLIGATATLGIGMPLAFSFMPEEVCEDKKLVRPVDLPIYESIHEVKVIEKKIEEPCQAQEVVKSVRLGILDGLDFLKQTKEEMIEVYEIGKAHTAGD